MERNHKLIVNGVYWILTHNNLIRFNPIIVELSLHMNWQSPNKFVFFCNWGWLLNVHWFMRPKLKSFQSLNFFQININVLRNSFTKDLRVKYYLNTIEHCNSFGSSTITVIFNSRSLWSPPLRICLSIFAIYKL